MPTSLLNQPSQKSGQHAPGLVFSVGCEGFSPECHVSHHERRFGFVKWVYLKNMDPSLWTIISPWVMCWGSKCESTSIDEDLLWEASSLSMRILCDPACVICVDHPSGLSLRVVNFSMWTSFVNNLSMMIISHCFSSPYFFQNQNPVVSWQSLFPSTSLFSSPFLLSSPFVVIPISFVATILCIITILFKTYPFSISIMPVLYHHHLSIVDVMDHRIITLVKHTKNPKHPVSFSHVNLQSSCFLYNHVFILPSLKLT